MADNHRHIRNSQVMTRYESQAARAHKHFFGEEGSKFCDDNALGIHHITECGPGDGNDVAVITLGQTHLHIL